jgi:hypothetical protein
MARKPAPGQTKGPAAFGSDCAVSDASPKELSDKSNDRDAMNSFT